jgi:hypothetical protein
MRLKVSSPGPLARIGEDDRVDADSPPSRTAVRSCDGDGDGDGRMLVRVRPGW